MSRRGDPALWKLYGKRVSQAERGLGQVSRHQELRLRPLSAPQPSQIHSHGPAVIQGSSGVFKPVSPSQAPAPITTSHSPPYAAYMRRLFFPLNLINFENQQRLHGGTQGGVWPLTAGNQLPAMNCRKVG